MRLIRIADKWNLFVDRMLPLALFLLAMAYVLYAVFPILNKWHEEHPQQQQYYDDGNGGSPS